MTFPVSTVPVGLAPTPFLPTAINPNVLINFKPTVRPGCLIAPHGLPPHSAAVALPIPSLLILNFAPAQHIINPVSCGDAIVFSDPQCLTI